MNSKQLSEPLMKLRGLCLTYVQGQRHIEVLKDTEAQIFSGESIALVGPSGSGKSTLLHIVGLLDRPDKGEVILDGRDCMKLDDQARTILRRSTIGFIYQFHQLLPEFTAMENVLLPQLILGVPRHAAVARSEELLSSLGLKDRVHHRPAELSGGEQQRVAIARAVANRPRVLLADEPTGNLDPNTADKVFEQLLELVRVTGLSAIIATHNMEIAQRMDRIVRLEDGVLVEVK